MAGLQISLYALKPSQRIIFCCKDVSLKADVAGYSSPKFPMVNNLRPGHYGDTNATHCGARPFVYCIVATDDTWRFEACQISYVNQELPNAMRARKSDGIRHHLHSAF